MFACLLLTLTLGLRPDHSVIVICPNHTVMTVRATPVPEIVEKQITVTEDCPGGNCPDPRIQKYTVKRYGLFGRRR